jgi:predicted NAD-dependent protein-ADP-ribosyltransferase YbiA (DUF1768 family)
MKTLHLTLLLAGSMLLTFAPGCRSKKDLAKETGATQITVPLSGKEYNSNDEYFRTKSSGKSPDLTAAKKIALNNAKAEMAGLIQATVKRVTDNYTNQRSIGDRQEYTNKFEEMTREVVNLKLSDVKIIGEEIYKEANNSYTYWIAIEASKESVLNGLNASISKNEKLKLDYDKMKFEQIFNEEMNKLSNEQP